MRRFGPGTFLLKVIGLSLHQGPEECRFALLIAGTVRRVNLNADRHLLQPLIQANCKVDVFFSLFAGANQGYRKASDAFEQEPDFEGLNRSGIEHLIKRRFSMHGSRVVSSRIFEEHDKEPQDIAFIDRNTLWSDKKRRARRNCSDQFPDDVEGAGVTVVPGPVRGAPAWAIFLCDDSP